MKTVLRLLMKVVNAFLSRPHDTPGRKIAVTMVLSDDFMEYFRVLLYSIRKHNPWFDHDLVIIHSPAFSPLSKEHQEEITALYPKTIFRVGNENRYRSFTPDARFYAALLKIEAFTFTDYDTVIYLDVDMLCLGDISLLFQTDVPLGVVPAGKSREQKEAVRNSYQIGQGFNSGVMVIGKKYLNRETYEQILTAKSGPHADQEILNPFFRWKLLYCLDHRYNYNALFFWRGDETACPEPSRRVRILHYAGPKPLERPDEARMRIWFEYQKQCHPSTGSG